MAGVAKLPSGKFRGWFINWQGKQVFMKAIAGISEKEALQAAVAKERRDSLIRAGELPPPKSSDKIRVFDAVSAEYIAWGKKCGGRRGFGWSKHHAFKKEYRLQFWADRLKLVKIQDVEQSNVVEVLCELAEEKTGKTVQGYREDIASFCKWCVLQKYLDADPLPKLSKLAKFDTTPKMPHRELEPDELQGLQRATPAYRFLIYRVALATGYRQNELRNLTVGCLDRFGPSLPLAAEFCKDRRDARQPISRELADELAALAKGKEPDAPLLPIPGKEAAGQNFDRDCTKAGIKRIKNGGKATFHSFRVNYINAVVKSGADLKTIMTLARHSSATMSMSCYAKADTQLLRTAAESVAKAMLQAATPAAPVVAQKVAGAESEITHNAASAVYARAMHGPAGAVCITYDVNWRPCGDSNPESAVCKTSKESANNPQSTYGKSETKTAEVASSAKQSANNSKPFNNDFYAPGMHGAADLDALAAKWPALPKATRASILALAGIAQEPRQDAKSRPS